MSSAEQPERLPDQSSISIVLPVEDEERPLADALVGYVEKLRKLACGWEILLVPKVVDVPGSTYEQASAVDPAIRMCPAASGWGAAVRGGLRMATGDLLCYTSWRRTSAGVLWEMVNLALRNPTVAIRANRRTRDTRVQRVGSLLFNLECRVVLQVPAWDINGTPKVFPRRFSRLLELTRDDDLLDAEFALVCERARYPVIEVPVEAPLSPGLSEAFDIRDAMRMYAGVIKLPAQMSKKNLSAASADR